MKIFYILLICLFCGCASTDTQTIYLLNQRLQNLEKNNVQPRAFSEEPPPNYYNAYPDRLNDAQKDFVQYMLNYLADEE